MQKMGFILTQLMIAGVAFAADPHAGDQASGGGSVFEGTIAQSAAAIIVFLLLFAVLYKLAWGPILTGLQDRESKIKNDLEQAEASAKKAQATLAEYQKQLLAAQDEVRRIIDQGRSDAQRVASQIKDQTQTEITQMRTRAERDIETAKLHAINDIYSQTAVLATQVAGKILQREIRPEDQKSLVEQSLAELAKTTGNN